MDTSSLDRERLKYISLFAGIGGFDLALNRLGHECVYANEWDKYSAQTYEKNFNTETSGLETGKTTNENIRQDIANNTGGDGRHYANGSGIRIDTRDITKVPTTDIPDHDLLVGGFPCQAFSIAGKRRGFDDTRGTLFFDIARILKAKRPRYFILENVKGLLSHNGGNTFKTIISTLTELGYDLQWQVLNSKNFGVPQNRERVFIVGHLRGEPRPEVFPIRESNRNDIEQLNQPTHSNKRVYSESGISPTLNTAQGGNRQPKIAVPMRWVRTEKGKEFRRNAKKTMGKDLTPFNDGYRELVEAKEDVTGTLTNALQKDALLKQDMKIRRLTPLECERLQGFPDGWTEGVSDTQRYKQLGNAVTVNVVQAVAERLNG